MKSLDQVNKITLRPQRKHKSKKTSRWVYESKVSLNMNINTLKLNRRDVGQYWWRSAQNADSRHETVDRVQMQTAEIILDKNLGAN